MSAQILIVDDDPAQRRLLEVAAARLGHTVVALADGRAALDRLAAPDGGRFQLMILDLVMPELDGMGVLERLPATGRSLPVIVQAAPGGADQAASALRAGAIDFLVKPASPERIEVSIQNALRLGALESEIARIQRSAAGTLDFSDIIASSPGMDRVIHLGQRAAHSTIPVLIEGESGVGKALIARAIHGASDRKAKPFVTVRCGALPETSFESLLFGHEKGAIAGATDRHAGKFQQANGGTLFLDEIGDLPLEAQAKLLRALQEGEIEPVGARRPVRIDIRLVSTTSRDLIALVKEGRFREDLYYRLNVFPIRVPPLRERREDVPELVRHFTARFAAEERKRGLRGVEPEALQLLMSHAWPGNIRQLENAIFRAVVLGDGLVLTTAEFPQITAKTANAPVSAASEQPPAAIVFDRPATLVSITATAEPADTGRIRATDPGGDVRPLVEIEAEMIRLALDRYRGRMATVARKLGIGRSTLYRKLKELGIAEGGEKIAAEKIAAE